MKYLSYDFFHIHRRRVRQNVQQFLRYVSVGGLMLAINLLIVWFLIRFFSTQYLIACAIAFALESFIAFYINRYWTFHSEISFSVGFRRCVVIGFYSTLAILCITYGFTHYLSMHYVSARTASTVIMGIIGYFLDMRFAFRV